MGICQDCSIEYPYLQKAHIVARHKGGTDDPDNIVLICPNCHHLRDRNDRVEWVQKRWSAQTPEERSEAQRRRMAALSPEARAKRGQRISVSKTGRKHRPGSKAGGARPISNEAVARRTEAVKAAWARKTPEELEAYRQKCREIKAKK